VKGVPWQDVAHQSSAGRSAVEKIGNLRYRVAEIAEMALDQDLAPPPGTLLRREGPTTMMSSVGSGSDSRIRRTAETSPEIRNCRFQVAWPEA
jgi:hypothetical protein